jgi:DNA-binding MarR family transcriptional regulator
MGAEPLHDLHLGGIGLVDLAHQPRCADPRIHARRLRPAVHVGHAGGLHRQPAQRCIGQRHQRAARCFVAKSGISMLVTRMVEAGRVRREADPVDARVWRLGLTPAGEALAEQAQLVQDEVIEAMTGGSSAAERKMLATAMDRASVTLEQMLRPRGR